MSVGHESYLSRGGVDHELEEFRRGVSLDVEFGGDSVFEDFYVAAGDMALVGTRMDGYALCAEVFAVFCEADHVGHIFPACVAQGGYLIDVDA